MYMSITELDHSKNQIRENIAVWGDGKDYPEAIRSIVREILATGSAERGDSTYYNAREYAED